jgi:hypothetical protein
MRHMLYEKIKSAPYMLDIYPGTTDEVLLSEYDARIQ